MTPGKASRYSGGCFFAVPEKAGPGLVLAGCIIAEYFCSIIFKYPFAADGYRLLGEELEDRFCKMETAFSLLLELTVLPWGYSP